MVEVLKAQRTRPLQNAIGVQGTKSKARVGMGPRVKTQAGGGDRDAPEQT